MIRKVWEDVVEWRNREEVKNEVVKIPTAEAPTESGTLHLQ